MGVTSKTVIKIECDNPNCPGNSLDPKSHEGWIQVSVSQQLPPPGDIAQATSEYQLYLPPTVSEQQFFCSPTCAGTIEQTLVAAEEAREAAANPDEGDQTLPEEGATKTTRTRAKKT